jgi:hypothetical protein
MSAAVIFRLSALQTEWVFCTFSVWRINYELFDACYFKLPQISDYMVERSESVAKITKVFERLWLFCCFGWRGWIANLENYLESDNYCEIRYA